MSSESLRESLELFLLRKRVITRVLFLSISKLARRPINLFVYVLFIPRNDETTLMWVPIHLCHAVYIIIMNTRRASEAKQKKNDKKMSGCYIQIHKRDTKLYIMLCNNVTT